MSTTATHGLWNRWLVWAALGFLLVAGLGFTYWWRNRPPAPPAIALDELEPEVARVVQQAREEVLAEPRSADAWGQLGQALLANQISDETTLVCFTEAERLDPGNPRWPYYAAGVLLNLGRPQEALPGLRRTVERCVRASVSDTVPRLRLAETLLAVGEVTSAETSFEEVHAKEPANLRARLGLGLLAYNRQDWQTCRTHLEACVGSPQTRKQACTLLTVVCQRLGDKNAVSKYGELANRLPSDAEWYDPFVAKYSHLIKRKTSRYKTAEQLEAQGRFAEALQVVRPMAEDYPDDYLPHLVLGRVLAQMGRFSQAEEHLGQARKLAPDKFQVYYLLSLTLFGKGEALARQPGGEQRAKELFREAIRQVRHALSINADFGFAYMVLGKSLSSLGQREEALAAFRQAVHCSPEYAENHLYLGIALGEAGELKEARRHLEQAKFLSGPNDPRPREALEKLKTKRGRQEHSRGPVVG